MATNEYKDPKQYKYILFCKKYLIDTIDENGESIQKEFYSIWYKEQWYSLLYIENTQQSTITTISDALKNLDPDTYFFSWNNATTDGTVLGFLYINYPSDEYNWYLHSSTLAIEDQGIKIEFDDIINGAWEQEQEKNNDIIEDLDAAYTKITQLWDDIAGLQSKIKDLELYNIVLNGELEKSEQQIKILQNQYNTQSNIINSIKNNINNLTKRNTDKLFIDICRISADGKYLEIDMHCNEYYTYKHFTIYNYKYTDSAEGINGIDWLQTNEFGDFTNRQLLRINTDKLSGPSMYYLTIEVELKQGLQELVEDYEEIAESNTIITVAVSDVTNAYFYLLPGLVQLTKPCDPCDVEIPTEIQRAFLVLWAHIEAMRLERWKEAELFYDLIKNNFQHCLGNFEVKQKSCNCHGQKQSNFNYRR